MDYRSREAVHIGDLFMQSQMANIKETVDGKRVTVGYQNRTTGAEYLRTTRNRLIRIDNPRGPDPQFNLLSVDRQRFEPWEPGFAVGERIDLQRPFLRGDLIPPQTTWQYIKHDFISRWAFFTVGAIAGRGLADIAYYAAHHALQAAAVGTAVGAGAAGYAAHTASDAHDVPPMPAHVAHAFDTHSHTQPDHDAHDVDAHPVPGTVEHPVTAPNGVLLDGTPESAAAAMLPSHGGIKVSWFAFDVHDAEPSPAEEVHTPPPEPVQLGYIGYGSPAGSVINRPLTSSDYVALKLALGAVGVGAGCLAVNAVGGELDAIRRDVDRRVDRRPDYDRYPDRHRHL